MGRHSAPDDADAAGSGVAVRVTRPAGRPRPGRHARPGEDERPSEADTDRLPTTLEAARPTEELPAAEPDQQTAELPAAEATAAEPAEPAAAVEAPEPKVTPTGHPHATAADLALIRARPDVRNRCIAAVVVPFVLYTAAMFVLGAVGVYLVWVWIPLVIAGVAAGSVLDAAHRREPVKEPPDRP